MDNCPIPETPSNGKVVHKLTTPTPKTCQAGVKMQRHINGSVVIQRDPIVFGKKGGKPV